MSRWSYNDQLVDTNQSLSARHGSIFIDREFTHVLALTTSDCLYKTVTKAKLYIRLITQHQILHQRVKLYQSVLQKVRMAYLGYLLVTPGGVVRVD